MTTTRKSGLVGKLILGLATVVAALVAAPLASAVVTQTTYCVVIDETAIGNGVDYFNETENQWQEFTDVGTNENDIVGTPEDESPNTGQRYTLPWFEANVGDTIWLKTSTGTTPTTSDSSFYTITSVPQSWVTAGPTANGCVNFVRATNPGFSDPNSTGLLDDTTSGKIAVDNTAFTAGTLVCAVVFDSDLSADAEKKEVDLKGANNGVVALEFTGQTAVLQEGGTGSEYTYVEVIVHSAGGCLRPSAALFRSLSASRTARGVTVHWRIATEVDTLGYNVYRVVNGKRVRANRSLIRARGGGLYTFRDRVAAARRAQRYWIQAVSLDGTRTWYGPARVTRRSS